MQFQKQIPVATALFLIASVATVRGQTPAPAYDLDVRVLPDARRLEVAGTVHLAPLDSARSSVAFTLGKVAAQPTVELVDAKSRTRRLKVVRDSGSGDRVYWRAELGRKVGAGNRPRLRFAYRCDGGPSPVYSINSEGSFAGGFNTAWYPQFGTLFGTGRVRYTVPAGHDVVATGRRVGGAGSPAEFLLERPSSISFASGKFTVRRSRTDTAVATYVLRPRATAADYADGAARVIDVLTREFGEYPFSSFAIVEVPDRYADSAGFGGASFEGFIMTAGALLDAPFNLAYYGHEIGHQWWGVTRRAKDQRGVYLFSEALSQYGGHRAVELLDGDAAARDFRLIGYPGYIWRQSALGYAGMNVAGSDQPLADMKGSPVAHTLANNKGFLVWEMLARTVGRDRLRAVFTRLWSDSTPEVEWGSFVAAVDSIAPDGARWFFDQWFERAGMPEWRHSWSGSPDSTVLVLEQPEPHYRTTLEIELRGRGGELARDTVEVRAARSTHVLRPGFEIAGVTVDPDYRVLHWTPELRAAAQALAHYERGSAARVASKNDSAAAEYGRAAAALPDSIDRFGVDFLVRYYYGRTLTDLSRWDDAAAELRAAAASPIRRPELVAWTYYQLARAERGRGDEGAARRAALAAQAFHLATGIGAEPARLAGELLAGKAHSAH